MVNKKLENKEDGTKAQAQEKKFLKKFHSWQKNKQTDLQQLIQFNRGIMHIQTDNQERKGIV